MKLQAEAGETVVKEGSANLMRGPEAVGGKIYLTDRRLVFESHSLNVQTGPESIRIGDIAGTEKVWTRVFGRFPMMPNSLMVTSTDGQQRRFVLNRRGAWAKAIEAARGEAAARE